MSKKVKAYICDSKLCNNHINNSFNKQTTINYNNYLNTYSDPHENTKLKSCDLSELEHQRNKDIISALILTASDIFLAVLKSNLDSKSISRILLILIIIFAMIAFTCLLCCIKYTQFRRYLNQEKHAYINGNVYIKGDNNKIYLLDPPECPYCKRSKKKLFFAFEPNIKNQNDRSEVIGSLFRTQDGHIYYQCPNNPEHKFDFDWTQIE